MVSSAGWQGRAESSAQKETGFRSASAGPSRKRLTCLECGAPLDLTACVSTASSQRPHSPGWGHVDVGGVAGDDTSPRFRMEVHFAPHGSSEVNTIRLISADLGLKAWGTRYSEFANHSGRHCNFLLRCAYYE